MAGTASGRAEVASSNIGAIGAIAAIVIWVSGSAARTDASAGSAMTASPSQFGARITRRAGLVDISIGRPREHAFHTCARGDVAPAPVHPQPQLRIPAQVHLE